jgi:hypothetical protein
MAERKNIPAATERLLWGVAAGRCEFEGCNKALYRHEVTGENDNYAEKAHIHAVSPGGARFLADNEESCNNLENLMLVCPQCHVTIDRNEEKYTPEILFRMKHKHEERIYKLTGIAAEMQSHMVYYTANIAGTPAVVNDGDAKNALALSGRYPTDGSPINLSQSGSLVVDNENGFFSTSTGHLRRAVKSRVFDIVAAGESIALFSLAPQPLLIYLGLLLNDKYNVSVFQCHRREQDKWKWDNAGERVVFTSTFPEEATSGANVALVFSLSSTIVSDRIQSVLGDNVVVYSITIDSPNRTFVTIPEIMDDFVEMSREVMEAIKQRHGKQAVVHVFPSMPVSLAVRFGMDYMSKTDNPLNIYDEQPDAGFVLALSIGETNEQ